MARLGTGIQLAAVGPQNAYLDLRPEVTPFYHKTVRSTRFASEALEDMPLQPAKFGHTAVIEIPPRGDLLGDMHLQIVVPAAQPQLGVGLPVHPFPAVLNARAVSSSTFVDVRLERFDDVQGQAYSTQDQPGEAREFELDGLRWRVVRYDSGLVHSTLERVSEAAPSGSLQLTVSTSSYVQPVDSSVAVVVRGDGSVVSVNDTWRSPLAYVLMRRARFVVDDIVIHDHERLWYDLLDRLSLHGGHVAGRDDMLGVNVSMARSHTLMLPLKFLCCKTHGQRQTFFPTILVPNSRVKVEIEFETFQACAPSNDRGIPTSQPTGLDVKLVAEHITLDPDERNVMLLRPMTLMYESAQDMDALNYEVDSNGEARRSARATVDLSELNLPVKALVWVVYPETVPELFDYLDAVESASLLFGSLERVKAGGATFSKQQVWTHSARHAPGNVYMYSFALRAGDADPSGALDFSVVQKPVLQLSLKPAVATSQLLKCKVWGLTYNWLVFKGGRVSQMFST